MKATSTPISRVSPPMSEPPYQSTITTAAVETNSTNGKYRPLCTTVLMFTSRYLALAPWSRS